MRFLAFLNIFLLHVGDWLWFRYPSWNGAVSAVSFFVILSGVMTGYNGYHKSVELSIRAVCKDMWKKVRKIYPLYFVTVFFTTFYFGLPELLVNYDFSGAKNAIQELLRHFLLLQSWFPEGYFSYNGVGWYLSTVMFLYLLNIPTVCFLKKIQTKRNASRYYIGIILGCSVLTAVYSLGTYAGDAHFLQYIFPPARIGQYIAGMVLGFSLCHFKEKRAQARSFAYATISELFVLGIWILSLMLPEETWQIFC